MGSNWVPGPTAVGVAAGPRPSPSTSILLLVFTEAHLYVRAPNCLPSAVSWETGSAQDASGALSGGGSAAVLWPRPTPVTSHFCFETSFLCVFLF